MKIKSAGLVVCGMIALWLGWVGLDRRVTEAESDASDATYVASDASSKADEAKARANEAYEKADDASMDAASAKDAADESASRGRWYGY